MFEIYDNNGNKLECEVLFTFNKNNKNFIVYSDQNGNILASYFETINDKTIIKPIKDEKDFDLVDKELEKIGGYNEFEHE